MANSDLKAFLRTLHREKLYAIINLSGLSLAIACAIILGLYLKNELTYDRHHLRHKQIFRVVNEFTINGSATSFAATSVSLGPMLKENYPEIKDFVRFRPAFQKILIRSGEKALYWNDVYSTDENVFEIFTHQSLYGDAQNALKDPNSAAVSETFARSYFGNVNPIGKTIISESTAAIPGIPRRITYVFKDLPENTHLKYHVLFRALDPPSALNPRQQLYGISLYTYLVLSERYKVSDFKLISNSFFSRFMADLGQKLNMSWKCWLQPLPDIHLHSDVSYDLPTGNRYYVYGFTAVALFILIIACINYVNLATARAARRAKEIGMRKIIGASRSELIFRFLAEAVLFSTIAAVIGALLVEILCRFSIINDLFGKPLAKGIFTNPELIAWVLGLGICLGLLSGIYPAIYLSSIAPLSALSSTQTRKKGSLRFRELLVFIQFSASILVIACTTVMALQMRYISGKPLGFDKENKLIINLRGIDVVEKYPVIKNELLKNSNILGIAASSVMISTDQAPPVNVAMLDNKDGVLESTAISHIQVSDNFLSVMGIQLVSGRDFSKKLLTDIGSTFIVNEALVKSRGWKDPVGKRIQIGLNTGTGRVIGVVKDFHYKSLHHTVEPLALYCFDDNFQDVPDAARPMIRRVMVVKLSGAAIPDSLRYLQEEFSKFDPQHPFEYSFLDESIEKLYLSETRLIKMTGIFSAICIFIACLGLYGLSTFTTEQRKKEIGIRKVLGASSSQIVYMLSRKILMLASAGAVTASIAAYFAIDKWMVGFAYRVNVHPLVYLFAIVIVFLLAFATVALQSAKTAQTNPAVSLRYE